jgi:hypothetical protein
VNVIVIEGSYRITVLLKHKYLGLEDFSRGRKRGASVTRKFEIVKCATKTAACIA